MPPACSVHSAERCQTVQIRCGEASRTPRPGLGVGNLDAVAKLDARPGIVRQEEVAVEIDVVAQRRDAAAGGDRQARLDHAAEHDAEPERARSVHHPDRFPDPARLGELDVDAVRDLRAARHVVEPVAVLVHVDRERRALLQRAAALVAGTQRLLAVLDAELGQLRQRVERLLERPPLVHVDLQRHVGDAANGTHALDVEAVAAAELELQPAKAAGDLAPRGGPCRRDPRARSSTTWAAPRRQVRAGGSTGRPASFPARSWSAPSIAARAACSRSGSRAMISSSANGSSPRRSACSSTYARADSAVSP